jgi:hypothetical protein
LQSTFGRGFTLAIELGNRKINPKWDSLLTPYQREILAKPGFGIAQRLPYLQEEEVKDIMKIMEECVKHVDFIIKNSR